jgi:hypothetical protein
VPNIRRPAAQKHASTQGQEVREVTQKVTLELPHVLVKKLKIAAIERGRKMRELVEEALVRYLE